MVITDLIHRLVGRSDHVWTEPEHGTLHIGYDGWETRRETVRSILQQSGVRLSEVERLRECGVVLDVILDDYHVGLRCSLEQVLLHSDWDRETLLRW